MIYHENRLLADDSHEISYLISSKIKNLSSAAVIAALRVKRELVHYDVVYSNDATNTTQLRQQTPNA